MSRHKRQQGLRKPEPGASGSSDDDSEFAGPGLYRSTVVAMFADLKRELRGSNQLFYQLGPDVDFSNLPKTLGYYCEALATGKDTIMPLYPLAVIIFNDLFARGSACCIALNTWDSRCIRVQPFYLSVRRWTVREVQAYRRCGTLMRLRMTHLDLPWYLESKDQRHMPIVPFCLLVPEQGRTSGVLRFVLGAATACDTAIYLLWLGDRLLCATGRELSACRQLKNVAMESQGGRLLPKGTGSGPCWMRGSGSFSGQLIWYFDSSSSACESWAKGKTIAERDSLESFIVKRLEEEIEAEEDGLSQRFARVYDTYLKPMP